MSSIQDALRKAQRERSIRERSIGLAVYDPTESKPPLRRRRGRIVAIGTAVLLMGVLGGIYFQGGFNALVSRVIGHEERLEPVKSTPDRSRRAAKDSGRPKKRFKKRAKSAVIEPQTRAQTPKKKRASRTGSPRRHSPQEVKGASHLLAESPKRMEGVSSGPPATLERAKHLRKTGDLKGAEGVLRSMIQRSPGDVDAMVALANLYLDGLNSPQKAYALYQEALLLDPSKASVQANLGVYFLRTGELDKAKTHTRRALELSPGTAEVHYNMSCIHALEGDLGRAEKALARAIQIDPRCADWAREDPDLASLRGRTEERKAH